MIDGGEFVLTAQRVKFSRIFLISVTPFKEIHRKIVHSLFPYSMHLATNYVKMHYKNNCFSSSLTNYEEKNDGKKSFNILLILQQYF